MSRPTEARLAGTREEMEISADEVADLLRTIANRNRLMIVCLLAEGEYSVGELEKQLGIRQPTLSQQLTVLREAGIVETRRNAKNIVYRLTDEKAARVVEALYVIFCGRRKRPRAQRRPFEVDEGKEYDSYESSPAGGC
jgi:DNA-binding transcriptional ArsR family regulator